MQYKAFFDAVDHLEFTKQLMKEVKERRQDFADYLKSSIGKVDIPINEENFRIVIDEVSALND